MNNKFKKGAMVMVNGKGKCDGKRYHNKLAIVVERDPFFKDYLVKFEDGSTDWLDDVFLTKID